MRAYANMLSALLPQKFEPPLQPSDVPDPMPQLPALTIKDLALNPPPPLSVSLQGRGGPLLLPSVVHYHAPLIPALRLLKGVTPLLPSNVPVNLAQLSEFPLKQGRYRLQPSAVNTPPQISS